MHYPDFYDDPPVYDWENQPAFVNGFSNLRKNDDNLYTRRNTVYNENMYNDAVNKKKEEKSVKKKEEVKHFLQGFVSKVQSWFGKKPETGKSQGMEAPESKDHVFSGIIKGIHNLFKKPEPRVIRAARSAHSARREKNTKPVVRGWAEAEFGMTPKNVFIAGHTFDGFEVYVAKAKVNDSVIAGNIVCPGMLRAGKRCVKVAFNKWSRCIFKYKILVGNSYVWYPSFFAEKVWNLHPQALIGGKEELEKGVFIDYICRARYLTQLFIGKLLVDKNATQYRKCIIPYEGKTEAINSYDILVDWWE